MNIALGFNHVSNKGVIDENNRWRENASWYFAWNLRRSLYHISWWSKLESNERMKLEPFFIRTRTFSFLFHKNKRQTRQIRFSSTKIFMIIHLCWQLIKSSSNTTKDEIIRMSFSVWLIKPPFMRLPLNRINNLCICFSQSTFKANDCEVAARRLQWCLEYRCLVSFWWNYPYFRSV